MIHRRVVASLLAVGLLSSAFSCEGLLKGATEGVKNDLKKELNASMGGVSSDIKTGINDAVGGMSGKIESLQQ